MEVLLDKYKQTLEFTREEMRYLRSSSKRSILPDAERALRMKNLKDAESYYSFLLFAESNLLASIEQMESTVKVFNVKKSSIERLTIYVDPSSDFLHNVYKNSYDVALSNREIENKEYKIKLIKEITKTLTKQQKNILDLYSRGFTHKEISTMLGCTRQNITATLKTIRKKINDEGWVMV